MALQGAFRHSLRLRMGLIAGITALAAVAAIGTPAAFAASDPDHVTFTLEGCRLQVGETLPNAGGKFICADGDYTPGNLGKLWNELDLVPHRLTADNGDGNQTYAVVIAADNFDAGHPGYDHVSAPTVNSGLSTGSCSVSAGPEQHLTPGVGGIDTTIYRTLTVTQSAGSHCVFDYYERLALGSHLFPGSALHSNLINQNFGTAGIGARDVSIPVKEIKPQELSKNMSASQGSSYIWNITKDSSPASLDFTNTCDSASSSREAAVTITVTWTRSAPAANGDITIVTNITVKNPAHRTITANVSDLVRSGSNPVTPTSGGPNPYSFPATDVAAGSTKTLTHTLTVAAGTANLNDIATATYTDLVTGVPVPGSTSATASAPVQTSNAANGTATVSDTETITGDGLTFTVDSVTGAPPGSSFAGGYVIGTPTTGPLTWNSGTVSGNGQVVFNKTVNIDQPRNTTGTLSDVATLGEAAGTHTADDATTISARACLTGHKFNDLNANGKLDPGEPGLAGVTIYVDVNGNGSFDPGEPSAVTDASGDYTIVNVPDGTFAIREVPPVGYVCSFPKPCYYTITIGPGPTIGGLDFGNFKTNPKIALKKTGPAEAPAGSLVGFTIDATNTGNTAFPEAGVSVTDAQCTTTPVLISKNGDATPATLDPGETWTYTCSVQTADTDTAIHNVANVTGTDVFGGIATATASADVVLIAPPRQEVLPEQIVPGTARITGPKRCVTRPFRIYVSGTRVASVTFYIDGRRSSRLTRPNSGTRFSLRISPAGRSFGSHTVVARVQFVAGSQTQTKTLVRHFTRCASRAIGPQFTG